MRVCLFAAGVIVIWGLVLKKEERNNYTICINELPFTDRTVLGVSLPSRCSCCRGHLLWTLVAESWRESLHSKLFIRETTLFTPFQIYAFSLEMLQLGFWWVSFTYSRFPARIKWWDISTWKEQTEERIYFTFFVSQNLGKFKVPYQSGKDEIHAFRAKIRYHLFQFLPVETHCGLQKGYLIYQE